MILYHTTSRPSLTEGGHFIACPNRVCRSSGKTYPHLCFSTEPLSGLGEWLYVVDLPIEEATKYEYPENFRAERQARHFAIPHEVLEKLEIRRERFADVTGNPWNQWFITVLDRRQGAGPHGQKERLLGRWALIWISREGVASARVNKKSEDLLTLEITATSDFDPLNDYVVLEHHEEYAKANKEIKETWYLETAGGRTPKWVIFPKAWETWVFDRDVNESAFRFIMEHAPRGLQSDIEFAYTRDSKHNKARAWQLVADRISEAMTRETGRNVRLGKLAAHSWTAVEAMPKRLAKRLAQHVRQQWIPPIPEPEYENPDQSGRVLLANLYGAYPKIGPGVDHAPQERPYQNLEGELGDDTPFAGSRKEGAVLAAS